MECWSNEIIHSYYLILSRLPLAWAANVTTRARHEGFIKDDHTMEGILDHINAFRSKCGSMLDYDWISIPLVYTQVGTYAQHLIKIFIGLNSRMC